MFADSRPIPKNDVHLAPSRWGGTRIAINMS
jgi:hypothetical protein